ncbi:MarR family winged helix-turn-helix transcriptional regulator [Paenibacillus thalictri]|uniref:MarR family transcriptional regulator n=1 Tax=Paenibacillus thalictri TaxID=2527873 RepID=A0A4Q9DX83_9BACL|nr:MarR family transcriptional regulator [Paenibacillus thalictri]TBL81709.1 MarR family transcriptional regulator [Paenibacillus thalictri]
MDWEKRLHEFEQLIQLGIRQSRGVPPPIVKNLSKQQLLLMFTLNCTGRKTVSELAEELQLSASATTIAINRLVRDKYIERTRDETDRRLVWVQLSDSAREIVEKIRKQRNDMLVRLFNNVTVEEVDQFLAIARKMLQGPEHKQP